MNNDVHWLVKFFIELIPQKDDDAVKLTAWRWKSMGMGIITLGLVLYGLNWLPGVPTPYALANSVDDIKADFQQKLDATNRKLDIVANQLNTALLEQKNGQIRQLNSDLIDARRYQCRAIVANDNSAKPFWNNRLQELKYSYVQLSGRDWPDLPCNSF